SSVNLSDEELKVHLRKTLPEYMVPGAFVTLNRIPTTPNGKVDRSALPAVDLNAYAAQGYEPPIGEMEQRLAAIWEELLHVRKVGRNHNFFELGGHSLTTMQLIARIQSWLLVDIP